VLVSPGTTRKVYTGDESLRLLIIGGMPGKLYEAPEISELGARDTFSGPVIEQLEAKGVDVSALRAQVEAVGS
jgi:hypothetical protein